MADNKDFWPDASYSGTNTLLEGATGTGKTHVISTLLEAGLEVFVQFTEPLGMEILSDTDPDQLHWNYTAPANPSWESMISSAKKINLLSFSDLTKLKSGIEKQEYGQFGKLLSSLANFKCDRTGKEYGAVDSWDNKRAIVVDSLSGINIMAMDCVVGSKPVKAMGEWAVAMDIEERLINKLCADTKAFFILTCHMDRNVDEVFGGITLSPSALGRKLAPRIPRFFSDVIHCQREGDKFTWSTATINADLKARNLPIAGGLPASFVPIVNTWKDRCARGVLKPGSNDV
jgi:hypothetical protein